MLLPVALGILAGTVALVLGSVVFRAGRARFDNQVFAAMAVVAGLQTVIETVVRSERGSWESGLWSSQPSLAMEAVSAALVLLFAGTFLTGKRPAVGIQVVALVVAVTGIGLTQVPAAPEAIDGLALWLLLGCQVVAVALLARRARSSARDRIELSGILLVAAAIAARWLVLLFASQLGIEAALLRHDLLNVYQVVVIGAVVAHLRLLGVRRLYRELAIPLAVAVVIASYCALAVAAAPSLTARAGVTGMVVAVLVPGIVVGWLGWTVSDLVARSARAIDPFRGTTRQLVERVLTVTGRVTDPEAVLAIVRGAIMEVFPAASANFWRASGLDLAPGLLGSLDPRVEAALLEATEPFLPAEALVARNRRLEGVWKDPERLMLVPVRKESMLYGVFELCIPGPVDDDDLSTLVALSDHLAVTLENLQLSSSLGTAGRELECARTFIEDLIESLPVGVVGLVGPELRVRLWNPAEERRTSLARAVVVGRRYLEEVAGAHLDPVVAEAIRRGTHEVRTFSNVTWASSPGSTFELIIAPLRSRNGKAVHGCVLIFADVTERLALQQELEEVSRFAAMGQFASAIAHDIRTPLTAIRMGVQILRSKVSLPAEDMEYFDLALEGVERLTSDVEQLLDFTKPVLLSIEDVNVGELVDDVIYSARPRAAERDVYLTSSSSQGLVVPADEVHLRQVLSSLCDNSIEASGEGGSVEVLAYPEGDEVVLVVSDDGSGIAPDSLDRIWDPFFTTRPDGTGLGLALVRKTVNALGGKVRATSEVGRGTRVEVRLPATRATEVVVPVEEGRRKMAMGA